MFNRFFFCKKIKVRIVRVLISKDSFKYLRKIKFQLKYLIDILEVVNSKIIIKIRFMKYPL